MTDSIEKAFFQKDLESFKKAVEKARSQNVLDREYNKSDLGFSDTSFKRGTALTNIVALTPFDESNLPYVEILLENGADPNHNNKSLGNLNNSVIENLIVNAEPNFVYADPESLDATLYALIKLLISYGLDTKNVESMEYRGNEVYNTIESVLVDYGSEIDTGDKKVLHATLCSDLSKNNNVGQLKMLAKSLGLPTTGNKQDLCGLIALTLVSTLE